MTHILNVYVSILEYTAKCHLPFLAASAEITPK